MTAEGASNDHGEPSVRTVVDGLETRAHVDRRLIEETLLPALGAVAARPRSARRAFVFLVGPPGAGKSTLAALVTDSARQEGPHPVDLGAVGIDGFHYPASYLSTHHIHTDTGSVPLTAVKGAPETFDVTLLASYLKTAADRDVAWPTYDRRVHEVVPGREPVEAELVLVEGNWLLLDEPGWRELATYAAFVIYLGANPHMLRDRLIQRKIRGGLSPSAAAEFYQRSDRLNVERVLTRSDFSKVDLKLLLQADGTIDQGELQ